MASTPPSDANDYCIALAMLHGATFDQFSLAPHLWLVWKEGEPMPIHGGCGHEDRGAAARKYCERHKLL